MQPVFKSITHTGEVRQSRKPGQSWESAYATYCQEAARLGVTHVQVNFLVRPYNQILLEEPHNVYAWFADYGASLDQFVVGPLTKGVYLDAELATNFKRMLSAAKSAVQHGLKPVLMLCEPRFVPERLFRIHPEVRGPRVDNPITSTTPWYALCTDLPEVRQHYQFMLATIMKRIPELAGISLFTHDSGAGFCYAEDLYAGPNGPRHCKAKPAGQREAEFMSCLCEAGRAVNPDFQVTLTTGVSGREREEYLASAPEGVQAAENGKWSWLGGLGDQWAFYQYGSAIETVGYEQARQERVDEFVERLETLERHGKPRAAVASVPTDGYLGPIRYVPHPFQSLEVLDTLRGLDVRQLICKGDIWTCELIRCEVNREAFASYLSDPELPAEQIVDGIAREWVGDACAPGLVEAWRSVDEAFRKRPLWILFYQRAKAYLPGPLVPDWGALTSEELVYFWQHPWEDFLRVPSRHLHEDLTMAEEKRAWMLKVYRERTLPLLEAALQSLEGALAACAGESAQACLQEQHAHIRHFMFWQRSQYNWCEAGAYLHPGEGDPAPVRTLTEVIDDEINVTRELAQLLGEEAYRFLDVGDVPHLLYAPSPDFVEQLHTRIEVMQRHRDDPVG